MSSDEYLRTPPAVKPSVVRSCLRWFEKATAFVTARSRESSQRFQEPFLSPQTLPALSTSAQLVFLSAPSPATGQNLQLRPLAATDGLLPGIKHSLLLLASLDDHSSGDPRIVRLRYCSLRRVEGARLYYCRLFR